MPKKFARLRFRILMKYDSICDFANALGTQHQSVSRKLTGKVRFTKHDFETWCPLLDIKPEEIETFFCP